MESLREGDIVAVNAWGMFSHLSGLVTAFAIVAGLVDYWHKIIQDGRTT